MWWLSGLHETCAPTTLRIGGAEDGRGLVQSSGFAEREAALWVDNSPRERDLVRSCAGTEIHPGPFMSVPGPWTMAILGKMYVYVS